MGGGDQPENRENPFEGLSDPLAVSAKIGEQVAAGETIDWVEVLKVVGVMRTPEGLPMPGAGELGATAVSMIAGKALLEEQQKVSRRNEETVDVLVRNLSRFENTAGAVHKDVADLYLGAEGLRGIVSGAVQVGEGLSGIARRLAETSDEMAGTLSPYRLNQMSEAARQMDRAARMQNGGGRW